MAPGTFVALALTFITGVSVSGCATVQPWQRGLLADSCMVFDASAATSCMTHWQEAR